MNQAWTLVEAELTHRRKGPQWLADALGFTIQRVQNWKTRGVPANAFPAVAAAFGESVEWISGVAPPKRKTKAPDDAPPSAGEWIHLRQYRWMSDKDRKEIDAATSERAMRELGRQAMSKLGLPAEAPPGAGDGLPVAPQDSTAKPAAKPVKEQDSKPFELSIRPQRHITKKAK